jgi:DNA-binding response OmpR family regulator
MTQIIYILDDDPVICSLISESLQIGNTKISAFHNWKKLETTIFINTCDLLLLDFQMPDYKGDEIISILNKKLPNLKILLLSGNENCEKILKDQDLKVSDIVIKPFDFKALKKKILALLEINNQQ